MSNYEMNNDIKLVAHTCQLSPTPLKNWTNNSPDKAKLFDMAYSAIQSQPDIYADLFEMAPTLTVANAREFHDKLGVPSRVERLSPFCVPVSTLRRWIVNKPHTYLCALIGIQQQIITEHYDTKLTSKLYDKLGLSYSELCRLILADPQAVKKLLAVIE